MGNEQYNVAQALAEAARRAPFRPAVVFPAGRDDGRARYVQLTFQQLNELCDSYAHGLTALGIGQEDRVLMMLHPGIDFIAVTFALLKMGAVPAFIDPGMGRKPFLQCVSEAEPDAFIGIPPAHALRVLFPGAFKSVKHLVTVGRRWFWGGATLDQVRAEGRGPFPIAPTTTESEAAIAFTSGSTGIPKGVVFLHGMFRAQIELLRNEIGIAEGEVDLPGLYIFALFNPALGVTTVFPDMDPSHPARVDPAHWVESVQTHGVTTSFGSPTIWKRVVAHCQDHDIKLPSIRRVLMAGAPVPPSLIAALKELIPNGEVYTPFGATEALPITLISGSEILAETAARSDQGAGMCVGRPLPGATIRIIRITDEAIAGWDESLLVPTSEVGEIVVKGPMVTRRYLNRPRETAHAKIREVDQIWHRMGDLGYFDEQGRLWFCGRKSHRVETRDGLLLPVQCEAIFNRHPDVARSALVGVGERGHQRPVLIVEPRPGRMPRSTAERERFTAELLALGHEHEHTRPIADVLFHPSFPVDVRHNAKIRREVLAMWAAAKLGNSTRR